MTLAAVSVGSLPTWMILAVTLFGMYRLSRGGAGAAVAELERSNKVLEHALAEERHKKEELGGEVRDLRVQVAGLESRTDLSKALEKFGETYESRAIERHEQIVVVLDLIAERLGPEPNGHGHERAAAA